MTSAPNFRHAAIIHRDRAEFVDVATDYLTAAVTDGILAYAIMREDLADTLRPRVPAEVVFADVERNPGRSVERLRVLADGAPVRIVSEPTWPERYEPEHAEVLLAEALVDASLGGRNLELLCGYAADAGSATLGSVCRSHRHVRRDGVEALSPSYDAGDEAVRIFTETLPEPAVPASAYCLNGRPLSDLRGFVQDLAGAAHLPQNRLEDLVLAVNEVATNSVRHAKADPIVRIWREDGRVICDIRDRGVINDPGAGRLLPDPGRESGRGLWLATQLCDLSQVRSSPQYGTIVRLHVAA